MRKLEARWIGQALADAEGPILNLGSSTAEFREVAKPHIDASVFSPLRERGVQVIHADIKDAPGVDVVGDVLDPTYQKRLAGMGVKTVLVSNLLEHVTDPKAVADACRSILPKGGLVCVTGPYEYPYHADPIDTMYRPDPKGFAALFGGDLVRGEIVEDGSLREDVKSVPRYVLQSLWRIAMWWRNPIAARARASAMHYLFHPFKISCALIRLR